MSSSSSSNSSASSQSSSVSYSRGIYLIRYEQARFIVNAVDGFRLHIVAFGANDMPVEIFRYLRQPFNINTGQEADVFDGVCSVPDLEEYPIGEPTGIPPFIRKSEVNVVFRSQLEVDTYWNDIDQDVKILTDTLALMDDLQIAEIVKYGNPPPADPPSAP